MSSHFQRTIHEAAMRGVESYFASPEFEALMKETVLQVMLKQIAPGREAEADRFIGHIAHRFYSRCQVTMAQARAHGEQAFWAFIQAERVRFGNPDFSWTEGGAESIADEELECCEAA